MTKLVKKKEVVATKKEPAKRTNPDIKKLAVRIKSLRVSKGYTNADFFAYENNISRALYSRWERGEDMRFSSLMKVIKAFEMTPEEFFREGFK
jgi:transcriptional regulator with XRE-family HTH domain